MYHLACCVWFLLSALGSVRFHSSSFRRVTYLEERRAQVTHFAGTTPGPNSHSPVTTPGPNRSKVESNHSCLAHLSIDDWEASKPGHFVLLSDYGGHNAARFGNQLFTGGFSIMKAMQLGQPLVVIPRQPQEMPRQIHKLPCLRSSSGAEEALAKGPCAGCNQPPNLWSDRNHSCNEGKGCRQFLQAKGILRDVSGCGFCQNNFRQWPLVATATRQVLEEIFRVPPTTLDKPVEMPGSHDLVMHFRGYFSSLFGKFHFDYRLHIPPFDFWKWTVEHHKNFTGAGRVWVVTSSSFRRHPTVLRLKDELGAQVLTSTDAMGKDAWLGDFSFLTHASSLALSFSTFSWWAGYIGKASTIYLMLPPTKTPADSWCALLPQGDARYVFYDFYNHESFVDGDKATQRCEAFQKCVSKANHPCPSTGQNFLDLLNRYYPEVVSNLSNRSQEFKLINELKASLAGDTNMRSKGNR